MFDFSQIIMQVFVLSQVLNIFIWMVAATLACLIVYGLYDDVNGYVHLSQSVKDLYNTTHRTVWGACVGWVVFACATGNGGEFLYMFIETVGLLQVMIKHVYLF